MRRTSWLSLTARARGPLSPPPQRGIYPCVEPPDEGTVTLLTNGVLKDCMTANEVFPTPPFSLPKVSVTLSRSSEDHSLSTPTPYS